MATTLNISSSVVLKNSPGKLLKITGLSATNTGTINDASATGGTNYICQLPATQQVFTLDWPCYVGIAVNISAGSVSVQWE
jgi:hypothetical protein